MSVHRIGVISANSGSVAIIADRNSQNILQIELEKYLDGFLYNTIVPTQTLSNVNPFNPPIPETNADTIGP